MATESLNMETEMGSGHESSFDEDGGGSDQETDRPGLLFIRMAF